MKVIIPVAGIGSKLRPHTHTQPKTLLPIAGKPMLSHIVDSLIDGGLRDFVFVLGYLGDKIEDFITTRYKEINAEFVTQEPREGSAHAIWVCREYIRHEKEILIVLGDTIASFNLKEMLASPYSVLGVLKVANPLQFGIAEMNNEGFIQKLIEKPRIPKSNLALVGIYKIINPMLLLDSIEYIIQNNIKINNEYYLTDALMKMIEEGEKMKTIQVDNWFDCGKKETLLEANAILLNINKHRQQIPENLEDSIIIPPVSIGLNCKISHSIIGPNVAVGENTILKNTILSDSIIGAYSELKDVVLKHSIVGNDTSIRGLSQSLNIGDNTEISFE
ncbi:MAG: sugar phosphate nucleotidyltransferase [Microscillaceae bacterium]|nr:sugar phosphate nucleotidyltransferase [Microscillaceae bacterium]